jgi:hypothetical protein
MVRAMTNTVDSLLSRPKFGYDGGYDMAVIGLNVVVEARWDSAKCSQAIGRQPRQRQN